MKILVSESQFNLIKELNITKHFNDRINERIISITELDLVIIDKNIGFQSTTKIGTFSIPQNIHEEILRNFDTIIENSVNIGNSVVFGVVVYSFNIKNNWQFFTFLPEVNEKDIINKINSKQFFITYQIPNTEATGNHIVSIIKNNNLITTFYSKSSDKNYLETYLRRKYVKNDIIIVTDPNDLEFYYEK